MSSIKSYVCGRFGNTVASIFGIFMSVVGLNVMLKSNEYIWNEFILKEFIWEEFIWSKYIWDDEFIWIEFILGLAFFALGIVMFGLVIRNMLQTSKSFKACTDEFKAAERYGEIKKEFDESSTYCKDSLRVGKEHIFPKGSGVIIPCNKIYRLRLNFDKDMKGRVSAILYADRIQADSVSVARINRVINRAAAQQEIQKAVLHIQQINPECKF